MAQAADARDLAEVLGRQGPPRTISEAHEAAIGLAEVQRATSPVASDADLGQGAEVEATLDRPAEDQLRLVVNGWLAAWNARDQEGYFSFYAPNFYFAEKKLNLAGFKKYRGRIMSRAKNLAVAAADLKVEVQGPKAKATFIQNYSSDTVKDQGEKTLGFQYLDGQWRIVEETFQPRP
jgi:ketosteroid isomerase-like protein